MVEVVDDLLPPVFQGRKQFFVVGRNVARLHPLNPTLHGRDGFRLRQVVQGIEVFLQLV
ncbi:hypothetical protein D9M70_639380 [compost metagenome]